MKRIFKDRINQERKRWAFVLMICAFSSLMLSADFSFNKMKYHLVHPLEFLKMEQENPFYKILTIFRTGDLPDKLKRFR